MTWAVHKMKDLVEAGVLKISDGYRVTNLELGPTGIPFVRGGDIGDGWINANTVDHIRPEFAHRVTPKLTEPGDVAFITKGTVGRVGFLRSGQPSVVFAPQVCYWRSLDLSVLDPRFIFYLLRGSEFQANLDAVKTHGFMAADYVSISDQLNFRLPIPSIADQRAIAGILGALDDKIDLNQRMSETLEAMARATFESWYVDGRAVQGLEGLRLYARRINEILDLRRIGINPFEHPSEEFDHYSIPAFDGGRTPTCESGNTILSNKYEVPREAVLLSKLNPHLPRVWLPDVDHHRRSVCSTEFLVCMPRERYSREFVYCLFQSPHFQEEFRRLVTGTSNSHQRVKPEYLLNVEVELAGVDVGQFNEVARPLLQRVTVNLRESRTLAKLRDTLLPKLLSGELRIKDAERVVGEAV